LLPNAWRLGMKTDDTPDVRIKVVKID